jgi:hypothetical protein
VRNLSKKRGELVQRGVWIAEPVKNREIFLHNIALALFLVVKL